ncbi:VTT domain-containing protein [soil metagenome]
MTILRPEDTVWRNERANRAAVLVDAAAFFKAVRSAFLKAKRSILVIGWDIDSRTQLVGEEPLPADGYPTGFADFLSRLVHERPELQVHLLLWDYSLLYAGEREMLPRLSLGWKTPERIILCLDDSVPFGSSQHQKIVVVDDALAFSGGLDLTIRRWDTSAHSAENEQRVDPSGHAYRPFHDVQMMVDGPAAQALALLARQRWCRVNNGVPSLEPCGEPWPAEFVPDFTDVDVGIARTQPRYDHEEPVREVEALFLASIREAKRHIYIENQFLSAPLIAECLAERLRQCPALEVVMVAPRAHESWIEKRTMRNGRIRFWRRVSRAGGKRVRLLYPSVEQNGKATDTMIHSKIMVVDDRLLRVGSANLNNRSMGADTECDLVIEAGNAAERAAILEVRNRLLGEHCGVGPAAVASALARHGSLVQATRELAANGHSLQAIDDGEPDDSVVADLAERVADPSIPLRPLRFVRHFLTRFVPGRIVVALGAIVLLILGFTLGWKYTALSELAEPRRIAELVSAGRGEPWAFAVVIGVFVLGGVMLMPLNIMVLGTAAAFGPWYGMLYSALGALANCLVVHTIAARFGKEALGRLLGGRWQRALAGVRERGVLAVATMRILPIAPYSLVNLAAGASGIRLVDFLLGSIIGLAPGLVLLSFLGDRLVRAVEHPSVGEIVVVVLCVVAYLGLALGAQAVLSRRRRRAT